MTRKIIPESGICCLDEASGLFHQDHFRSVLGQELARLDRWERPLSLILLDLSGLDDDLWSAVGRVVLSCLRSIDLAARLGKHRVAVLLPDADVCRSRRWLVEFLNEFAADERLTCVRPAYGRAIARPWEGRHSEELLILAEKNLGYGDLDASCSDEIDFDDSAGTAIAADERNSLFDGFKVLGKVPLP